MKSKLFFLSMLSLMLLPVASALTSGEGTVVMAAIFSMSVIVVFFLILSIIVKNNPMKVFFMSMSFLTILASVGMGVSVMQESFSSLTNIISSYGGFYILLVTLTVAGLFALIIWLVVIAFKSFNSYRGLIDEEEQYESFH